MNALGREHGFMNQIFKQTVRRTDQVVTHSFNASRMPAGNTASPPKFTREILGTERPMDYFRSTL